VRDVFPLRSEGDNQPVGARGFRNIIQNPTKPVTVPRREQLDLMSAVKRRTGIKPTILTIRMGRQRRNRRGSIRQRQALALYHANVPLAHIGAIFGISREGARQLVRRAKRASV